MGRRAFPVIEPDTYVGHHHSVRIVNAIDASQLVNPPPVERRKNISVIGELVHHENLRVLWLGIVYHAAY